MSLNKVMLIGNIGNDPEIRSMQNGKEVCNLSVATSENWKDRQTGERRSKTQWHRIVIFNEGLITISKNYLRKGSKVYIEGQLETRKWQGQDGRDNYTTEVVLRPFRGKLIMLDGRNDGGNMGQNYGTPQQQGAPQEAPQQAAPQQQSASAPPLDDFEDEIPF